MIKNRFKELKEKKKKCDDVVLKLKKEGNVTDSNSVLVRINDLTDLVLAFAEEKKEK